MKGFGLVVGVALLVTSGLASAGIIVTVPDKRIDIDKDLPPYEIVLTVEYTGSYNIDSYELAIDLSGRDGATGVIFNGAVAGPPDYIFTNSVGWSASTDEDFRIYGDDGTDNGPEALADVRKNLILVDLDPDLNALNLALQTVDYVQFDVTIDADWTAFYDPGLSPYPDVVLEHGVITFPEPASLALLCVGGLVFVRRRRR